MSLLLKVEHISYTVPRALACLNLKYTINKYFIDDEKPTLKKLQKARVISGASSRWYQLGIELLDDNQVTQLEIIKKNNDDVMERCTALFSYWLRTHPNCSWHQLVAALREPDVELNELAASVEEKYVG